MRKKVTAPPSGVAEAKPAISEDTWLDIESLATVEVTSERDDSPIENALLLSRQSSWRAAQPGQQTIRLIFDRPRQLRRIHLVFKNLDRECTQEFLLRWSADPKGSFQEIVRQQWNFSPPESVREVEDYQVNLDPVAVLELTIVPDIRDSSSIASLSQLRLA